MHKMKIFTRNKVYQTKRASTCLPAVVPTRLMILRCAYTPSMTRMRRWREPIGKVTRMLSNLLRFWSTKWINLRSDWRWPLQHLRSHWIQGIHWMHLCCRVRRGLCRLLRIRLTYICRMPEIIIMMMIVTEVINKIKVWCLYLLTICIQKSWLKSKSRHQLMNWELATIKWSK